jgi:hypothetical protein
MSESKQPSFNASLGLFDAVGVSVDIIGGGVLWLRALALVQLCHLRAWKRKTENTLLPRVMFIKL